MGMSASQARLLSITARISDVEFKSQQISNNKLRLADESEQIANNYTQALNRQKLTFTDWSTGKAEKSNLNSDALARLADRFRLINVSDNSNALYYTKTVGENTVYTDEFGTPLEKSDGTQITTYAELVAENKVAEARKNVAYSQADIYEMIESGQFMLQEFTVKTTSDGISEDAKWFDTSVSSNTQLSIETDSTDLAKAEAEYNAETAKVNRKEKLLDNDLKAVDTERQALTTEQDSIKTLIQDNIKGSFELFS